MPNGAAFPKAGDPYVYLNRGLSPLWGFLFGWMISFLERPVGMATLAAGFLRFLGFLFPVVGRPFVHTAYRTIQLHLHRGPAARGTRGGGCHCDQLLELLKRLYHRFNARDMEGVLAAMREDVVWANGM